MKAFYTRFALIITASFSTGGFSFPELPFCPAGGPPGWMNYFNYNPDHNIWRRYSPYAPPAYGRPDYSYNYPPIDRSNYNKAYYYSTPAYHYNQKYSPADATPTTNN